MSAGTSRVVAITGASAGIGKALAIEWAKRGASVVINARSASALDEVAREVKSGGGDVLAIAGDVTNEEDRARFIEGALAHRGQLDVLVNNAGRGYYGTSRTIDVADLEAILRLNVIAPLRLAQLAIEPLARTRGTIVMMSSVAGVVAAPRLGAYAASKFALEALSMSLRAELKAMGICVVVIRPGPVDTEFRANSVTTDGQPGVRPPGAKIQTAEAVAAQTIRAVERGTPVVETSAFVKLASGVSRHAPALFRVVTGVMAKLKSE